MNNSQANLIYDTPLEVKFRTKPICDECRTKKKKCLGGPWPLPCERCRQQGLPCSKPKKKITAKRKPTMHEFSLTGSQEHCIPAEKSQLARLEPLNIAGNSLAAYGSCIMFTVSEPGTDSRDAIILLSMHSMLLMAIEVLIGLAVDMLQAHQRCSVLEQTGERIPVLQTKLSEFKSLARQLRERMLAIGRGPTFITAQHALNASATPYFLRELTSDPALLAEARKTIADFYLQGHTSLAYVLQLKLLQGGVSLENKEVENLLLCRQHFTKDLKHLLRRLRFPDSLRYLWEECQMFTPSELVRIPAVAKQIILDSRPDFLGRQGFHILEDAITSMEWGSSSPMSAYFSSIYGRSKDWSVQALNSPDVLGRTAIHLAVRHDRISSITTFLEVGADMHQLSLNGLSLLHIAACHGRTTMIDYLIDKLGPSKTVVRFQRGLDRVDDLGRTPFWYAARGSYLSTMHFLTKGLALKSFATIKINPEHEDQCGDSALSIAARHGRKDVLSFLFRLRQRSLHTDDMLKENLLLAIAVQSNSLDCIKVIARHRTWEISGKVFERAMAYADQNQDPEFRAVLFHIYSHDAFYGPVLTQNTTNEFTPFDSALRASAAQST